MPRPVLTDTEIREALDELAGWDLDDGKLTKHYEFPTFSLAFGFMACAAPEIEKADHHPEWRNVYNKVDVQLFTHDSQGITQADVRLARLLDNIANKLK